LIFLPNKFERYTAALRNTMQKRILKQGITTKNLMLLQKIHRAEAFITDVKNPCNLKSYCSTVLSFVYIRKTELNQKFEFSISVLGNYIINKKLFLSLILTLASKSESLAIKTYKNYICIKSSHQKISETLSLIKKLDGIYFLELKTNQLNILIPAVKTEKEEIKKDQESFLGPLSVINFYIN